MEPLPDLIEVEDKDCTCGTCAICILRKALRRAEEEALNSEDSRE